MSRGGDQHLYRACRGDPPRWRQPSLGGASRRAGRVVQARARQALGPPGADAAAES